MKGFVMLAILGASAILAVAVSPHLHREGMALLVAGTAGALGSIPTAILISWLRGENRVAQETATHDLAPLPAPTRAWAASMQPAFPEWLSELPLEAPRMPARSVVAPRASVAPSRPASVRRFTVVGRLDDVLEAVDLDELWMPE